MLFRMARQLLAVGLFADMTADCGIELIENNVNCQLIALRVEYVH